MRAARARQSVFSHTLTSVGISRLHWQATKTSLNGDHIWMLQCPKKSKGGLNLGSPLCKPYPRFVEVLPSKHIAKGNAKPVSSLLEYLGLSLNMLNKCCCSINWIYPQDASHQQDDITFLLGNPNLTLFCHWHPGWGAPIQSVNYLDVLPSLAAFIKQNLGWALHNREHHRGTCTAKHI